MAQTITKSQLEERVAELEAQLAEAQQNAFLDHAEADGKQAQLRIKICLPESMEAESNGWPLVNQWDHDGVPYMTCTCPFMSGNFYGKPYNKIQFGDHYVPQVKELIRQGNLEVEIEAYYRTSLGQSGPHRTYVKEKWVVTSLTPVNPVLDNTTAPTAEAEVSTPAVDEDIPF